MNSKQKLEQVLEYIVNGESEKASELLKSYVIEQAAEIHQSLVEDEEEIEEMEREVPHNDMGDDLADEIDANKEEIADEEMMGEDEDLDAEPGEEEVHDEFMDDEDGMDDEMGDEDLMDLEDLGDEITDIHDEVDSLKSEEEELSSKFEELEAAFNKIKNTEEEEHGEDFDDDGQLGDPEAEHADGEYGEPVDGMGHDETHESIEEAMELTPVKADMKDKTAKQASPVAAPADRLGRLGGEPVKTIDKGHKGFEKENGPGVKDVTKNTNTVKSGKDALVAAKKPTMTDKAPGAGSDPAMPKGKK